MTRVWFALPLLSAACANQVGIATPAACSLRLQASIPVALEQGFVAAPARIGTKPVTMLIDTGAEATVITPSAAAAFQLERDRSRRTAITGIGGVLTTQNTLLPSLGIGGMADLDESVATAPLPTPDGSAIRAAGLIGADWLSRFDVELDLAAGHVRLWTAQACSGEYQPWTGPRTTTPIELYGNGLVILPVRLDGHALRAILDSGARHTTLSAAAATPIAPAQGTDRPGHAVGVDGTLLTTREHVFRELDAAGLDTATPRISIQPFRISVADMLLGVDWLRHARVWISYATRRVTVQAL